MSSANKKKETLTSIIKANLTKPFLTVEILNDFKLCTKEEARSGLKTAFNNVKRWKNYKNIKKLVTAYENFANDVRFLQNVFCPAILMNILLL